MLRSLNFLHRLPQLSSGMAGAARGWTPRPYLLHRTKQPGDDSRRYGYACFYWLFKSTGRGASTTDAEENRRPSHLRGYAMTLLIFAAGLVRQFRFVPTVTILQQADRRFRRAPDTGAPR